MKENEVFAFKLCLRRTWTINPNTTSLFILRPVLYRKGYITRRPGFVHHGPLAVFSSLKYVKQFRFYNSLIHCSTIYAGVGSKSKDRHLWYGDFRVEEWDLPDGTVLVDDFKPIIEVFI